MSWNPIRKASPDLPQLPQEVNVPRPSDNNDGNGGEITAWAPKRYNVMPQGDQALETVISAERILIQTREQLVSLGAQINDRDVRIGILEGRCSDLELANAQLRNDLVVSRTAETDAKREASDWLSLWQNVAAMISNYEIGAVAPSAARRKAKGAKNGDHPVPVPQTETLTSEAPKPEAVDGQTQKE